MTNRLPIAALALVCAFFSLAASALGADRAFAPRFSANDTGDITMASNSLLTCLTPATTCANAKNGTGTDSNLNNNAYTMANIDTDADGTTFNSSSANLNLPPGSTVLFAGLYWGGDFSGSGTTAPQNAADRNKMKLKLPGAPSYTDITASVIDESALNVGRYQAFADVTSLVASGGAGNYFGANVQAGRGSDHYAGWSLVVAYRDPSQPARNLTIYDGLKTIRSSDPATDITVTGFQTPPSGPVNTKVGMIAYEGDLGITGDTASLKSNNTSFQTLSDGANPATNFFNSSIEPNTRNPSNVNNFGYDADLFSTTNVLGNNATSATLRLTTSGDQYLPGVITFATELFAPKITQTKTVTDVNGGEALPGDVLEYVITNTNSNAAGTDAAVGFVLRDPIPNDTTYVPGSIRIAGAARTDAAGDDTGNFDSGLDRVETRLGAGANATAGGRLAPGASVEVRFRVTVDSPLPDDRTIENNATASFFSETIGTPLTATSSVNKTVGAPDLTISKTRTSGPIVAGSQVDYDIDVENVGDASTLGTVTVSDTLPAGLTVDTVAGAGWSCTTTPPDSFTCTRSNALAPGASYPVIQVTADVDPGLTGPVTNTAHVSGGSDINYGNNSSSDTTETGRAADIQVTKTASPTTINVGETSTFTIVVRNDGPSRATSVGLDDPIPAGLVQVGNATTTQGTCQAGLVVCDLGDLAPGATATVTVTVRATSYGAGRTMNNTATATSTGAPDPTPGNNSDDANVTVRPVDLAVVKSLDPNPPTAGGPVTYTIVATNDGPSDATGVTVYDNLPANLQGATVTDDGGAICQIAAGQLNCAIGNLAAGASVSIEVQGTMSASATSISNTATIGGAEIDPNPVNNKSTVTTDVTPVADLAVVKSASPTSTQPGDEVVWAVSVTNNGPSTAINSVLTDTLPAGVTFVSASPGCSNAMGTVTCNLGDIPSGDQRQITIRVSVNVGAPSTITNTATVGSDVDDPDPTNNTDDASVSVSESADLSVEKTADLTDASPGDTITYTLTVRNDGPNTARNVVLSDSIPAGLSFDSSTPGAPTCVESSGSLTCDLGDIPSGQTRTVTVRATVLPVDAPSDHQHQLQVQRVQSDLTLDAGETDSVDVDCPSGMFATDASVLILDNAGNVDGSIVPDEVEQNGDGYRVTATNSSTQDNMQTRVSIVCLGFRTLSDGNPSHDHPLIVSAPVTRTEALGVGTYTFDLECGPGQVAVAPSFAFEGDPVRVRGSFRNGTGWRFVLDSSGGATADLAIRCLSEQTGEANGHTHSLALAQHTRTVTIGPNGDVVVRIECGPDGKGIVASYDLDPGLISLGNEPEPVNRDFRIQNPDDAPHDARLGLLCLGERTTNPPPIGEYVNTASASSTTPDPDSSDNSDSVTVDAAGPVAPIVPDPGSPAPAAPEPEPGAPDEGPADGEPPSVGEADLGKKSLSLEVSCEDCSGTGKLIVPRKVRSGKVKLDPGDVLGRDAFDAAAGDTEIAVKIGKRKANALRKEKMRSLLVELNVADVGASTQRVPLSRD